MSETDRANTNSTLVNLPLFPLGLVLFPGGRLPLKIFEQRYVEMTKACLRDDSAFGVCLIRHGSEVGTPAEHEAVGCSARIINWEMPHPGLFQLDCAGERVFRVVDAQADKRGLIGGKVEWLTQDNDMVDPRQLDICRDALQRFIQRAGESFFVGNAALDDPEWVSNRLAEALAIDMRHKQALLEQRSTARRLAALSQLLQPG